MFLYKLYSVCVSILIVENLFDLIKFFFFLLEICFRLIDDDEKNFLNYLDLLN